MLKKPQLAGFYIDWHDLSERNLMSRILIGIENITTVSKYKLQFIEQLPSIIRDFWQNDHHGLNHSFFVFSRALELLERSPSLKRHCLNMTFDEMPEKKEEKIKALLTWAALLHDFGRALGFSFEEHQDFGANLARSCFLEDDDAEVADMSWRLRNLIIDHDYLRPEIDGKKFPEIFFIDPLAEAFRLADKTSITPAAEMLRYYQTGKRVKNVFYDPEITDAVRFDFSRRNGKRDMICYAFNLFLLQPENFFYRETADAYAQWSKGKLEAFRELIRQAREAENLSAKQILEIHDIIKRGHEKLGVPFCFD
ncbi:MAG: HD domain-containing protein [Candidatus Buchananbacteria bacterium]